MLRAVICSTGRSVRLLSCERVASPLHFTSRTGRPSRNGLGPLKDCAKPCSSGWTRVSVRSALPLKQRHIKRCVCAPRGGGRKVRGLKLARPFAPALVFRLRISRSYGNPVTSAGNFPLSLSLSFSICRSLTHSSLKSRSINKQRLRFLICLSQLGREGTEGAFAREVSVGSVENCRR